MQSQPQKKTIQVFYATKSAVKLSSIDKQHMMRLITQYIFSGTDGVQQQNKIRELRWLLKRPEFQKILNQCIETHDKKVSSAPTTSERPITCVIAGPVTATHPVAERLSRSIGYLKNQNGAKKGDAKTATFNNMCRIGFVFSAHVRHFVDGFEQKLNHKSDPTVLSTYAHNIMAYADTPSYSSHFVITRDLYDVFRAVANGDLTNVYRILPSTILGMSNDPIMKMSL